MRHKRAGLHLSRTAAHRKALFSNMVSALLTYERIRTTEVKAKEIRRLAERTITWARRLGPILTKKVEKRSREEQDRVVHAMRMALRVVRDRDAVLKLFEEIGPRFLARHGGYTRIMKIAPRAGDAAPMVLLELLPAEKKEGDSAPAPKGRAGKEAKEAKASKEPASKSRAKSATPAQSKEKPKAKPKAAADTAAKARKDAAAKAPAKSGATAKRGGRSRGGE